MEGWNQVTDSTGRFAKYGYDGVGDLTEYRDAQRRIVKVNDPVNVNVTTVDSRFFIGNFYTNPASVIIQIIQLIQTTPVLIIFSQHHIVLQSPCTFRA